MERDQFIREYIEASQRHAIFMVEGYPHQTNKEAKTLRGLFDLILQGEIDKTTLIDLIGHENIAVRANAASDMLRFGYQVEKAIDTLEKISKIITTNPIERSKISSVKSGLWVWNQGLFEKVKDVKAEQDISKLKSQ